MKTLALLTLSLAVLTSTSTSFAEPYYKIHRDYRSKRIIDESKKCLSPFDYRCSTSNGG
jgi:hypothetical protein